MSQHCSAISLQFLLNGAVRGTMSLTDPEAFSLFNVTVDCMAYNSEYDLTQLEHTMETLTCSSKLGSRCLFDVF